MVPEATRTDNGKESYERNSVFGQRGRECFHIHDLGREHAGQNAETPASTVSFPIGTRAVVVLIRKVADKNGAGVL